MKENAAIAVASAAAELSKNKDNIELQKAYQEALNEQAGIEAQITGFRSEQQTNANSLLREQKEIMNEIALLGKSEIERERLELEQQYELSRELIEREITDDVIKKERLLAAETDYKTQLKVLNDEFDKAQEEKENQKIKLQKLRTQQTLGDAQNTFNQIAQLAGKDSKVGKAMAIASATISGVQGVQNAYTTAQKSPITLAFPAYPAISAGLAGAVALKNIASIKSVNPSGGGGASVTKPSVPTGASTPPSFNVVGQSDTNQLASAIGGQSQQPVQAYVVANDVTTAQSMDRNIIDDASLGD